MTIFIKYRSMENSYQAKFIQGFLAEYPELQKAEYILVEKAHGSNMQFCFTPNQPYRVGKRTSFLGESDKFYGIWNVIPEYTDIIQTIQGEVDAKGYTLHLYGELYGAGVQKGVDYGRRKKLGFFDVIVNDVLLPPIEFYDWADKFGFIDDTMPIVDVVRGLQAALDYNVAFNSLLNPIEDNLCEGIVIKPYNKVYYDTKGRWFCLKKKNEKFMEKGSAPKPPREEDSEIAKLNIAFREYITEARLQSIFSKFGEIEEPSQIGEYIRLVLDDAKEDFLKDCDMSQLNDKEQRQVFNVGSLIANLLKGYL